MSKNVRKLTVYQTIEILDTGLVYSEVLGDTFYAVVEETIISSNTNKNSVEIEYVIQDLTCDKFFRGVLGKSEWIHQDKHNANVVWEEVQRKEQITYYYE